MSSIDYAAALKQGRRSYRAALTRGSYPYLPVLDDILSYTEVAQTVNLGLMDIPLSRIVGTKTAGRTNAFADNFMPLLPEESEFSFKWSALFSHQIEEGIQDPIVAYEFMNRFYVLEGNKRVSVMKYLETYSIQGTVTRLVPKRSDDKENRLYYEFLDFFEVSHHCDIWFTREGSYKKLLQVMCKKENEIWDEEERIRFRSAYNRFAEAFRSSHSEKLSITVSDAFLSYVKIYGYDQTKQETTQEMFQSLQKIWMEILLTDKGSQVKLVENPQEAKPNLLNRLLPAGITMPEDFKVAFVHPKTTETSSWTYTHELGRMYLEQAFHGRIQTLAYDQANNDEQVEAAIEAAISQGCNLIFTTATQMINQSVRSAIKHPKVKIYNCSVKMSYTSICTYYARMYESKFLIGAIAAAVSRTNQLGYVADYPIYGTIANINAFALGARMINPYVKVHLEWSRIKNQNARKKLQQAGIVFISDTDMITPQNASREYGLYEKHEDGSFANLATPLWHWGKFYERIVRSLASGVNEASAEKGKKAVNYWWGLSAEVIDIICSPDIPHGIHQLIVFLKHSIRNGSFHPFDGEIYSQDGVLRSREGENLDADEIITMDWLADNVVGQIPEFEELTEEAQTLVQLQGIKIDENKTEN